MGQSHERHGRRGRPGRRPHGEIGYHAIRVGDNPGEHTIVFGMLGETLELTVRASSRDCYAAGALAAAALDQIPGLAGATVVCILSGGNNDVSRYPEIVERSLVHEGLKHYFLISFPQEPGALRRFLDHALGPDDDITLFEYVKRSNRETGPALVGIELARRTDLEPLLARLAELPLTVERITPEQAAFRFLV